MTSAALIDDFTARVDAELEKIVNERGFPLYDTDGLPSWLAKRARTRRGQAKEAAAPSWSAGDACV